MEGVVIISKDLCIPMDVDGHAVLTLFEEPEMALLGFTKCEKIPIHPEDGLFLAVNGKATATQGKPGRAQNEYQDKSKGR